MSPSAFLVRAEISPCAHRFLQHSCDVHAVGHRLMLFILVFIFATAFTLRCADLYLILATALGVRLTRAGTVLGLCSGVSICTPCSGSMISRFPPH